MFRGQKNFGVKNLKLMNPWPSSTHSVFESAFLEEFSGHTHSHQPTLPDAGCAQQDLIKSMHQLNMEDLTLQSKLFCFSIWQTDLNFFFFRKSGEPEYLKTEPHSLLKLSCLPTVCIQNPIHRARLLGPTQILFFLNPELILKQTLWRGLEIR